MEELTAQTADVLVGKAVAAKAFVHRIAFNCIPHIGGFKDDGYTSEEQKMVAESRKLLGLPALRLSATAVRVPTLACHGESINVECECPFEIDEVRAAMQAQAGVILQDDPKKNLYPMGHVAGGQDAVYVGRIRKDASVDNGLNLWVVSDNLRKGAALNAVQIGEVLVKNLF
jgi:aspartate-semialdehyde dehydrogenase